MTLRLGIRLTEEKQELARPVVAKFAKNLFCFNDICSYEKELCVQEKGHTGACRIIVEALANVGPESATLIRIMALTHLFRRHARGRSIRNRR